MINPLKKTTANQPWWLIQLRAGLLIVVGLLVFAAGTDNPFPVNLLAGLSVLLAGLLAIRFWQVSKAAGATAFWFLLNGLVDGLMGLCLLVNTTDSTSSRVFFFSFWGVLVGVLGAAEAMFIFLGIQESSRTTHDVSLPVIHVSIGLVGGALAFLLINQPLGVASVHYAGWPIALLGVLLAIGGRQLKKDAQALK